jgi:hypothetical protein
MIDFNDLMPDIIGEYHISDWFSFTMRSVDAPKLGCIVNVNGDEYSVDITHDDTEDEERENGLSFTKIYLMKN